MIWETSNFINKKNCEMLMKFHENNFKNLLGINSHYHRNTEALQLSDMTKIDVCKQLTADIIFYIRKIESRAFINYFQIVKWPTSEYQDFHIDRSIHPLTSIVYLNDNYEGGQTIIEDKIINPEQGKIITFMGNKLTHKVEKITKGVRFTLATWFKV